jgi:carbon starvation protein
MAMIAACVLEPGIYFAINSPAGLVGAEAAQAVATISSWGFPVTVDQMNSLAQQMGETSLFARTGGAPSLAVGMASIFSNAFGGGLLAVWYHFAIMFEALFILTTVDAGTRVARFMLQDLLGNVVPAMGRTSWYPSVFICSALVVLGWGYFLYNGTIDPLGGINSLWPLFGIANQMLAAIALCVATTIIVKSGRAAHAWVTAAPLAWLVIVTTSAAWEKLFSPELRVGFLSHANDLAAQILSGKISGAAVEQTERLIFNDQLDAILTAFFLLVSWVVVIETLRICLAYIQGRACPAFTETPYERAQLVD